MTTIIGIQHANGFVMAADSQITADDRIYVSKDVKKIVEIDDYVIAGAGISRYCDVIMYGWTPPKYDGSDRYNFMVSKFIPSMKKAHDDCGYILKDEDTFQFLVGITNSLFQINYDYSVYRTDTKMYGIGSGAQYAIGALSCCASIQEAMNVSKIFDINTGGKIQIVKRGKLDA